MTQQERRTSRCWQSLLASRIIFKDHELDEEECYCLPSATGLLVCQHLVPQKDFCDVNAQSEFRQSFLLLKGVLLKVNITGPATGQFT